MGAMRGQVSGPKRCLPITKSRRGGEHRQQVKRSTAKARRRAAKRDPENAERKGYRGWSW
jgi:hypothetical protein